MHFQQRLCDMGRSTPSLSLIMFQKKKKKNPTQAHLLSPLYPTHPICFSPRDNVY